MARPTRRRGLVPRLGLVALLIVVVGCASGGVDLERSPTPQASDGQIFPSGQRTESPGPELSADATPQPSIDLRDPESATAIAIAEGTLGMSMPEYVDRYNGLLDQGQYPITDKPSAISDQVFHVIPQGANHTALLFVVNGDQSLRSVTVVSDARLEDDAVEESLAQLESIVIWSAAGPAALPGLSESEQNNLLGSIGIDGARPFGDYAVSTDIDGVRLVVMETDEGTSLIIREAN